MPLTFERRLWIFTCCFWSAKFVIPFSEHDQEPIVPLGENELQSVTNCEKINKADYVSAVNALSAVLLQCYLFGLLFIQIFQFHIGNVRRIYILCKHEMPIIQRSKNFHLKLLKESKLAVLYREIKLLVVIAMY